MSKKARCAGLLCSLWLVAWTTGSDRVQFRVGAAAVAITPFGQNVDWDGGISSSGVWGERFTDKNGNGRWDSGEPFEDDSANTSLDRNADQKYDGIYLAGFGNDRLATGKHDDLWARALILEYSGTRIAIVSVDLLGYYSNAKYYGAAEVRKLLDPTLGIQEVLIASTHNHEGPDTVGVWGVDPLHDESRTFVVFVKISCGSWTELCNNIITEAHSFQALIQPANGSASGLSTSSFSAIKPRPTDAAQWTKANKEFQKRCSCDGKCACGRTR